MSELTPEEILKIIEENGGPKNLNLSGKDLSEIDLSSKKATELAQKYEKLPEGLIKREDGAYSFYLSGANLQGAFLLGARLEGADLTEAKLEGAYFYRVYLDRTRLSAEQLKPKIREEKDGDWEEAKEAYLILKNNFRSLGRYQP